MRAREITLALGGKWFGSYGVAFCPAHENRRTPALSLKDGDGARLLAHCHAGCDFRDVRRAMQDRGLLNSNTTAMDHRHGNDCDYKRQFEERRQGSARAQLVWRESIPIEGTLGELYLRQRGIEGMLPESLRFNPSCWHPRAQRLPALVAAISKIGSRDVIAIHRTYLQQPGMKSTVDPSKAMLGPAAGCCVEVSHGLGPLIVAEGIETSLSLAEGLMEHQPRVVAALSTSGMSGLRLPDVPHDLIIAPDGDYPGEKAARALGTRAAKLGWHVRILPPPGAGLDWNDAAMWRQANECTS